MEQIRKWNGAGPLGKKASHLLVLKVCTVSLNWTIGSQAACELVGAGGRVMLTKSSAAKVTARESLARRLESRIELELVCTTSATRAPLAARRIGATKTPSA